MNISTYRNTNKLKFRVSKITCQISFNKLQSVQGKKLYDKLGSGNYYTIICYIVMLETIFIMNTMYANVKIYYIYISEYIYIYIYI